MVHNDMLNVTMVFFYFFFFVITDLNNFSLCNVIQQIKKVLPKREQNDAIHGYFAKVD